MEIPLHVLIYQEDGEWLAHLLEMDLVGAGETAEEAQASLHDAFEAQITFCVQENVDPFRPAPAKYFRMWNKIQRELSKSLFKPSPRPPTRMATYMEFTEKDRSRYERRKGFVIA